ncbi:MAG: XRE family transcriptional regulator [Lachnospiraceae bacterium]|nr:XRE family transcriptional regulator [Lachnospiraceae bacterium]
MSRVDQNIAVNLKRIRKERNMSLDMLAEQTGVSKSMLGQIERGESNPTVATISKIVEGIRISFEDLLYRKEDTAVLIDKDTILPCREQENAYRVKEILPFDKKRSFEIFNYEIEPGKSCDGEGTGEIESCFVTVLQGKLSIMIEEKNYEIEQGKSLQFEAGRTWNYSNRSCEKAVFEVVLSYNH